jgi:hypothetical protein
MAEIIKSPAEEALEEGASAALESVTQQQAASRGTTSTATGRTSTGLTEVGAEETCLPSPEEFLKRYELARKAGVSPYNWLPPEWKEGQEKPTLKDTVLDNVPFPDEGEFEKKRVNREAEQQPGEEEPEGGKLKKWPHPRSDFSHIDPDELNEGQWKTIKEALKESSPEYKKLQELLGPESLGLQRLGLVFERALYKAHDALRGINQALAGAGNRQQYIKATTDYIELIKDLEDHEPETKHGKVKPGEAGYGSCVKWVYIDPVIVGGVINGASVVLLWNPHSTSSGISVGH